MTDGLFFCWSRQPAFFQLIFLNNHAEYITHDAVQKIPPIRESQKANVLKNILNCGVVSKYILWATVLKK